MPPSEQYNKDKEKLSTLEDFKNQESGSSILLPDNGTPMDWIEITDEIDPKLKSELMTRTGQSYCFYPNMTIEQALKRQAHLGGIVTHFIGGKRHKKPN